MEDLYIDAQFIRDRITNLRMEKGVSEREMSLSMGMSESYIRNVTSAQSLPSMDSFLNICEYLRVTPSEFFDPQLQSAHTSRTAMLELERVFGRKLGNVTTWLKKLESKHADTLLYLMNIK